MEKSTDFDYADLYGNRFGAPAMEKLLRAENTKIQKGASKGAFYQSGDPTRTRTWDPMVKSHLLYRLSYRTTG